MPVEWNLMVILICISLMMHNVFLYGYLPSVLSFLVSLVLRSSAYFLIRLFICLLLNFKSSLHMYFLIFIFQIDKILMYFA